MDSKFLIILFPDMLELSKRDMSEEHSEKNIFSLFGQEDWVLTAPVFLFLWHLRVFYLGQ